MTLRPSLLILSILLSHNVFDVHGRDPFDVFFMSDDYSDDFWDYDDYEYSDDILESSDSNFRSGSDNLRVPCSLGRYYSGKDPTTCGGYRDLGVKVAEEFYSKQYGRKCAKFSTFQKESKKCLVDKVFAGGDNGFERAFNECARDGVMRYVYEGDKKCDSGSDDKSSSSDTFKCSRTSYYSGKDPKTCKKWKELGEKVARKLFRDEYKKNCDNLFEFAEETTRCLLDDEFDDSKCARDGVRAIVDRRYKTCLTKNECNEYGRLAAELVILDFCKVRSASRVYEPTKIKRKCKEQARIRCRDNLKDVLRKHLKDGFSCDIIDDKLDKFGRYEERLEEKCRTEVLSLMET